MPEEAPGAIQRGMIVRHKGRICYVRHVAAGYARIEAGDGIVR